MSDAVLLDVAALLDGAGAEPQVADIAEAYRALATALAGAVPAATDGAQALLAGVDRLLEDVILPQMATGERLRLALAHLAEIGPPSELRERAPAEAAGTLDLDRVVLSRIDGGLLVPESIHVAGDEDAAGRALAAMREAPVKLDYPLVEGEVLRRRRPTLVRRTEADPPGRQAWVDVLGWREYVTAPIVLDSRVIGFLHGDRLPTGRALRPADAAALGTFGLGFALVFERAILRGRLRTQRQEMRQVASWADARTSDLSDRAITLAADADEGDAAEVMRTSATSDAALRDLLTRRELDVLKLMVKGETNAAIARDLVVSEGTVKFHVKNILRKLHAANRAEATSRYLRLTLGRGDGFADAARADS